MKISSLKEAVTLRDFPRFILLGDDRINVDDIVAYGLRYYVDEDGEIDEDAPYIYVQTKSNEFDFEYVEEDFDCTLEQKLTELDAMFLVAAHRLR